ncbi:MAG: polyphosphate kinase 1 [Bacteroidota bacterium]
MGDRKLKNRDINWLYFNERVLLEAAEPTTPLLERIKFLAIFSSNLDEYFKVRISQLRQLKGVDKKIRKPLISKPNKTLKFILKEIGEQQKRFGEIILSTLASLKEEGLTLHSIDTLGPSHKTYLKSWFEENKEAFKTMTHEAPLEFKDGNIYMVACFDDESFEIISLPTKELGRFLKVSDATHEYVYLDDALRTNIQRLFPEKNSIACRSIKISRDAELYLDDDYTDTELVEIIHKALPHRNTGQPTRVLYDPQIPEQHLELLKEFFNLDTVDMVSGGVYHNVSDFFGFPNPFDDNRLSYPSKTPLNHPQLSSAIDFFELISKKDQLVHFPYQSFDCVEQFMEQAAMDSDVTSIKISLYRIAKNSKLSEAVLLALRNQKEVVIFVEAQARFDEENNIKWGRIFQEHGAKVIFSVPNIKVHSKILLIEKRTGETVQRFAYIGTGNFNAKTAKLYCDHGLFTANTRITRDLAQVFGVLEGKYIVPKLKYLLVSPFNTRLTFLELIEYEIEQARLGLPAKITLKMNSLEDTKMIRELLKASKAGVDIRLLVRGFCCLSPTPEDELEEGEKPIKITSIVDRYLEHGRIYLFHHGGKEKMYMGSADWMTRNLDRRIEVLTPILDPDVFQELYDILQIQLNDNVKARILDAADSNTKVSPIAGEAEVRSQYAIYDYLKTKIN